MQLKRFSELAPTHRSYLYSFLAGRTPPPPYPSRAEMEKALTSPAFGQGQHFLTLWAGGERVVGTLGIITKEAAVRGEVFITGIYVLPDSAPEALPRLLHEAYRIGRAAPAVTPATVVRLGVRQGQEHLLPVVTGAGFEERYRVLEMSRDLAGGGAGDAPAMAGGGAGDAPAMAGGGAGNLAAPAAALRFAPVTPETLDDYVAVHNAAFVTSPNGALLSQDEAAAALAAVPHPECMQVGYLDSTPAAILDLRWAGEVGEIEALAVAPGLQQQGLGRLVLWHALRVLQQHGTTRARLQVIDANQPAYGLYLRNGFTLDRVVSTWFVGPSLIEGAKAVR